MIALVSLVLCLAGFVSLCLSLTRHQRDLLGRDLPRLTILLLRLGGYFAIFLGFVVQALAWGPAYGVMVATGLLTVAAVLVVAGLTLRAHLQTRGR
jgi:hypothetical protein